jgi:hypothetical protein
MKKLITVALSCSLLASPSVLLAEDKPAQAPPAADMMKMFEEMSRLNEHHKAMEAMAGTFKNEVTMKMSPDAPPQTSSGESRNTLIFGGKFLQFEHHGEMWGTPFQGLGFLGYDNALQKHVSIWLDSMSTGIMRAEGTCDETGKVITFKTEMADPMNPGQMAPVKFVYTIESEDSHTFDWYETHGGNEFKSMTIRYTRVK